MSLSLLLSIYVVFLLIYSAVLGFAVYKVFMFSKNKDLKGYSKRMTFAFLATVFFIIFITFLVIRSYDWNDGFSFYCKQLSPGSCFCEINADAQRACQDVKNTAAKQKQTDSINNGSQLPKI